MKKIKNEMPEGNKSYEKPVIIRVDLALDETLATGCKLDGTPCIDGSDGITAPDLGGS